MRRVTDEDLQTLATLTQPSASLGDAVSFALDVVRALASEVIELRGRVAAMDRAPLGVDVLAVHAHEDATTTTVIARIAALGLVHTPRLAWKCGAAVRDAWERRHGAPPPKANTTKANGSGNHCHARYPLAFAPTMDDIILALAGEHPSQGRLDFDAEES